MIKPEMMAIMAGLLLHFFIMHYRAVGREAAKDIILNEFPGFIITADDHFDEYINSETVASLN